MNNPNSDIFFANSVLNVKSSGVDQDAAKDLELPQGKSIAELLYDQEKNKDENSTQQ